MSGIFKGDSIYKSGGGGGGFKDGGQLVDGDFIKVENNTISSYDNVSRDPVNFYFEVKDGEVLNSVVELTTAVNATINVYILKNGFYYLLGNVGGNTVNAGDDYKLNVTGDSYSLEQVTPGGGSVPSFFEIDGVFYPLKEFNGYLWLMQNLAGNFGLDVVNVPKTGQTPYGTYLQNVALCDNKYFYRVKSDLITAINQACAPFHVPTSADFSNSGLLTKTCGEWKTDLGVQEIGCILGGSLTPTAAYLYYNNDNKFYITSVSEDVYTNYQRSDAQTVNTLGGGMLYSLRLCCKLSDL